MEISNNKKNEITKIRFINVKFIKSASKKDEFIQDDLNQIAIVGRSNVGKSSLINNLVNQKRLAKTSSTAGLTKMVNYFLINNTNKIDTVSFVC